MRGLPLLAALVRMSVCTRARSLKTPGYALANGPNATRRPMMSMFLAATRPSCRPHRGYPVRAHRGEAEGRGHQPRDGRWASRGRARTKESIIAGTQPLTDRLSISASRIVAFVARPLIGAAMLLQTLLLFLPRQKSTPGCATLPDSLKCHGGMPLSVPRGSILR